MSDANPIAFSEEQQGAVIGHLLAHPQLWETIEAFGVTKEWFQLQSHVTVFATLQKWKETNGRFPNNPAEFVASIRDSRDQVEFIKKHAKECYRLGTQLGWDLLEKQLLQWAKFRVIVNYTSKVVEAANDHKLGLSFELEEEKARELAKLDRTSGNVDEFDTAADQLRRIHADMERRTDPPIEYGVPFLDDVTTGIYHHDLHILTALTGIGKTEIAKNVGIFNAMKGRKVAGFFLEARPQEVEIRYLYGLFQSWFKKDHPSAPTGTIDYLGFSHNQYKDLYAPYKAAAEAHFDKHLKTFKTYYRKSKDFTVKTLESKIVQIATWADLVILDHLHYIDTPGKDENREMHDIVKKLRDLSIHLGNPMLVVAHVRKAPGGRKEKMLLPENDDLQGSGAIGKMATGVISLGRSEEFVPMDARLKGASTFMRASKLRDAGDRTRYTAVSPFNVEERIYEKHYALGRLTSGGTKWEPAETLPYWAKNGIITEDGAEVSG